MSRTALFIIDIQHALAANTSTQIPHAKRVVDATTAILIRQRTLIKNSRTRGETPDSEIIIVQHEEPPENGPLQKGSQGWTLVFPPLTHRDGDEYLVSKNVRNTFQSNPHLAADLKARGVGTIVACGIQTECCVLSTGRGALAAGFKVVLLSGAHSTYDVGGKMARDVEREVELVLSGEGVEVVDWEEWVSKPGMQGE